ncbi:MAG: hypothetical protein WC390_11930 [Sulfurimonas sp.]|jgi:hypothetical protein
MYVAPEYMGLFGLSFEEKLASATYKKLQAIDKTIAKKLKDFFQAGGLNIRLIQNMYREYTALMAQNYKPANFTNNAPDNATLNLIAIIKGKLNIDDSIISNFLLSLQELAAEGIIPYAKWNPKGFKESTALQKTFSTEQSIIDKTISTTKEVSGKLSLILIVAGLGVSFYYINKYQGKKNNE